MSDFRTIMLTLAVLPFLAACDLLQARPLATPPPMRTVEAVTVTATRPQNATVVPPSASGNQFTRGQIRASKGQAFEYVMLLPESWANKFGVREQGNAVFVEYRGKPDMPQKVFSFAAYTDAEWQAAQSLPHGIELFRSNGVVFAYDIAKANPFTDPQDKNFADEFQQSGGQVQTILKTLSIRPVP